MSRDIETGREHGGIGVGGAILRYTPSKIIEPVLGMLALPFLTRTLQILYRDLPLLGQGPGLHWARVQCTEGGVR